jgi:hypothetical protein
VRREIDVLPPAHPWLAVVRAGGAGVVWVLVAVFGGESLKVRIIKASKPTYWYADKIGCEYPVSFVPAANVRGIDDGYYIVHNTLESIDKFDCEVIEQ